jgi:hypothetical protein
MLMKYTAILVNRIREKLQVLGAEVLFCDGLWFGVPVAGATLGEEQDYVY